jgi:stage II sporulation protein D
LGGTAAIFAAATAFAAAVGSSCRSAGRLPAPPPAQARQLPAPVPLTPPVVRIGILPGAARVSIGANSGVVVTAAGKSLLVERASFRPQAGDSGPRLRLLETGDEFELVTILPQSGSETLSADADAYRGVLEVRAESANALTVINAVNLEDYLRGVVPNELSPSVFPELEALKAQAIAARTYALKNLGGFKARGYDLCATAACQVYRGRASEQALSDQAVRDTSGLIAAYKGELINALYTSTCGGHTEDGTNVFEGDAVPYLKGVVCAPERESWGSLKTSRPRGSLGSQEGLQRDVVLLQSLDVVDDYVASAKALRGLAADAEIRGWIERLQAALHRKGCTSPALLPLQRRASFFEHVTSSFCWDERARRLLSPADPDYLLQVEDRAAFSPGERLAAALLLQEGVLMPGPDNTLRPNIAVTRAEALQLLAGIGRKIGPPALRGFAFKSFAAGRLVVEQGDHEEGFALDPQVALFRTQEGHAVAASEVSVAPADRLQLIARDGRVVYLEAEQPRLGPSSDRGSRYFRWEQRLTPDEVAKSIARYGDVGQVRDVEIKRLGISGRVVEVALKGSRGELPLRGLKIRWGLGLRENLFVIDRERDESGAVARFVFTGKGWGHGVGLCQVGAYGMAQAGASFERILQHYYSGVQVQPIPE